jgi:hypothetical protein
MKPTTKVVRMKPTTITLKIALPAQVSTAEALRKAPGIVEALQEHLGETHPGMPAATVQSVTVSR